MTSQPHKQTRTGKTLVPGTALTQMLSTVVAMTTMILPLMTYAVLATARIPKTVWTR